MVCWPLPHFNMHQPQAYTGPLPLNPSFPAPSPPHPSTGWGPLCHAAHSHLRSVSHVVMYLFPCYSLNPPHSLLPLKERQISHVNACVWNLERRYRYTYLQGSNGDAGMENPIFKGLWRTQQSCLQLPVLTATV